MKLPVRRIAWSVAVGFALQAALAMLVWWGIPGLPPRRMTEGRLIEVWQSKLPGELGKPAMFATLHGFGRTHTQVTWKKTAGEDDGVLGVNEGGWPWRSLSSSYLNIRRSGKWSHERWGAVDVPEAFRATWYASDGQGAFTWVPIRPLAVGTLLNTLVWGSAVFGVLTLAARLRDRFRAKRGECAHCRYTVKGLPVCPECGKPVGAETV